MKLTFIGAAHEVTGSCTLLEACVRHILIDCGMEQGKDVLMFYPRREMDELTEGKVEYGKANSIVKNMFYLSKSRQTTSLKTGKAGGIIYGSKTSDKSKSACKGS